MRFRLAVAAALVVALVTMSAASLSIARVPDRPAPLDPAAFQAIAGSDFVDAARTAPEPSATRVPGAAIEDFADSLLSFPPRPEPAIVVAPTIVLKATPRPPSQPAISGGTVRASGPATWYCKTGVSVCHHSYPGGMYAAAGPGLRVGNWRGRVVRVCGNGRCVTVRLIDWCACGGGHLIDLYSDAFQRLAPLSAGTVRVTVSW